MSTETKAQHTAGPWSVSACAQVVADSTNALVADVFDGRPNEGTDLKVAEANASLIAAAPELLEEGRKLVAWLDRMTAHAEKQAKDNNFITLREAHAADAKNFRAAAKTMKAIIAKVEGRE